MATNKKTGEYYFDGFIDGENGQILYSRIPKSIWNSGLSTEALAIYCYLLDCINWPTWSDSRVFPNRKTIMEKTGVTKYKISTVIQELVDEGWLSNIVERMNESNVYFVNLEQSINDDLILRRQLKHESQSKLQKDLCKDKPAPEKGKKYTWKKVEIEEVGSEIEPIEGTENEPSDGRKSDPSLDVNQTFGETNFASTNNTNITKIIKQEEENEKKKATRRDTDLGAAQISELPDSLKILAKMRQEKENEFDWEND